MDTKAILKYLKLNESNISMILGALVIVILGFIVIRYFRNQPSQQIQTGTTTEEPTVQPIIKRGEGPVEYTITEGESLWSISEKQYGSGYNWVDIAQANDLTNPDVVSAGQKITIPDVLPKTGIVMTDDNGGISTQASVPSSYVVKKGDSLWQIAVSIYGDGEMWAKIASTNKLNNPNLIHTGNQLSLPK